MKKQPSNNLFLSKNRIKALLLVAVLLFIALFGRLFYIQIFQGSHLQIKGASQWYRDLPLSAPRGKILDTNGLVLVDNKDVYTVFVRPRAVADKPMVARTLSQALSIDYNRLLDRMNAAAVSEITVLRQVPSQIAEPLIDLRLDGVYFTLDSRRNYPHGDFLTQVLGFTDIDNIGQSGLEAYYDKFLKGTDGLALTPTDIRGIQLANSATRYVPPIPGADITLTIDLNIQAFATDAVKNAQKQFNSQSASMLIMDATNGGIVASAQTPSFNLNNIPRDDIATLNALSKNTMLVDVFEPGSTFKIFTTALALENQTSTRDALFPCAGFRMVDGQRIKCWRSIGHGIQMLDDGVKNSCNCVFMDLALDMGVEMFYKGLRDFGFGSKTGIDFFSESKGILMNEKYVKNVDLARIGFGHAVATTPLQLVAGVAAAVNGGNFFQPHFLQSATSGGTGIEFYKRQNSADRRVISEQTSEQMRQILASVVSDGSGKKAGVQGFSVGGKTGTAQKYKNGVIAQGKYVSSFIGFAPADNPKYVALMVVDEPEGYLYYGSLVAAPFVGQVFDRIFDYKGMVGDKGLTEQINVAMPELVGRTLDESVRILNNLGVRFELCGEGSNVIGTVPVATTIIATKKDIVLIRAG